VTTPDPPEQHDAAKVLGALSEPKREASGPAAILAADLGSDYGGLITTRSAGLHPSHRVDAGTRLEH
jgi:hypothetical protein